MKIVNGIAVLENDSHISKWVEETGNLDHDRWLLEQLLPLIPDGGSVVDCGAFIGDHTIAYLGSVGDAGSVLAFEPNQESFECLAFNCPAAVSCNIGLSDRVASEQLEKESNAGSSYIIKNGKGGNQVSTIPLDMLKLSRLDYFKLDCEGYEPFALKGARHTIQRCKPIIVCEVNSGHLKRNGFTHSDLRSEILNHGYSISIIQEGLTWDSVQFDILCIPHVTTLANK